MENASNFARKLYRLLDSLPEQDPLTIKLKENTLAILEQLSQPNQGAESYYHLLRNILVLQGCLDTAKELGWIQGINSLILEKEINEFKDWLIPLAQKPVEHYPLRELPKPVKAEKKHSKRHKKILELMSGREKTQVGDIVKELGNVTKRTVRRDIDELLGQNKIIRFGEFNQVFYRVGQK